MEFFLSVFLCLLVAILPPPIASQEQCLLPTNDSITGVGEQLLQLAGTEGQGSNMLIMILTREPHFTCLATVAKNMYSSASVVVEFYSNFNSDIRIQQYQLDCSAGGIWVTSTGNFDDNLPEMPFTIETQFQCSQCLEPGGGQPGYDAISNCVPCASECLSNGGGFCTGPTEMDCCPGFDSVSGSCVICTDIDPNFGPDNETFLCECSISCGPGHTADFTNCTCELTDGCAFDEEPCLYGGTCMSNLTAAPYYYCMCAEGYSGQNCSTEPMLCDDGCREDMCDFTSGCCQECNVGYILVNCSCNEEEEPTTNRPTLPPPAMCPDICRCDTANPGCCVSCPTSYTLVDCECVADVERALSTSQVTGIAIGLLLFILLILSLAVLLAYVIYYMWTNKQRLKKGTALSPFSNGESHSNPLYLTPEEVEVED